jgi:SNF2 family DNA or RNA helicase
VAYYGGVSADDRALNKTEFQLGNKRFFVGNAQTGGIGLNLTKATTVIYYSNTFSSDDRLQSEDRAHRIGQNDNVLYIDLEADDTIDHKIINALKFKKNLLDYMMALPKWV